ncbi:MAG: chemotaxis protein CheA [Methanocalculus sp. MSAO_Arc1]|uniref:chemotaxis protein CheW n=1 Tax=Methanocalculus TaxID=71151 RepID=UPI000FF183D4|nr:MULTISPECIES: chemotaxis protein CheW [unclassified Methanocalculus]MCP1661936.1 two-component system chemotaxis sensor kinase CheA [Methanocalculus sp. AMF5]RQD80550.1 MAG: chemotaxis protein CheA [Methanocalculus sp. MSAO_Arc1]
MVESEFEQYRGLFVAESRENHEVIVRNLLILEGGDDSGAIDEIFRAAHTLKGASASMGFETMEHLCHAMEDVFQAIRNDELSVTQELMDLLLSTVDSIEEMIDAIEEGEDGSSVQVDDLVESLSAVTKETVQQETGSPVQMEERGSEGPEPGLLNGYPQWRITITIEEASLMKDVRALIAVGNLEQFGTIYRTDPPLSVLEDEDGEGAFSGVLTVFMESDAGAEALISAASGTEVTDIAIESLEEGAEEADPDMDEAKPGTTGDLPHYHLVISVAEDSAMKGIRACLAMDRLSELGTILSCDPPREAVEDGLFDRVFHLTMASDAKPDLLKEAAMVPEIQSVDVKGLKSPEAGRKEPPPRKTDTDDQAPRKKDDKKSREIKNLRVDIQQLDRMMNLVEDLVINRGRLKQIAEKNQIKEMDEAIGMIDRSVSDLQVLMMDIRMIPLNHIFNRLPRVVRDTAHYDGKDVEFVMEGGDTELDRSVMDGLNDPLLHLIRNAVNHGIEPPEIRVAQGKPAKGLVMLSARRDRDNVIIELKDDGGGINVEKVKAKAIEKGIITPDQADQLTREEATNYLFHAGFSTAEKITDISGRGVGLDVVRGAIESLKGSIRVTSQEGKGSTFELLLPPTMAIVEVMIVRLNSRRIAIPISAIVEVASMRKENIHRIGAQDSILLREEVLPLHMLEDMFGSSEHTEILVVVLVNNQKCCIAVDLVEGQQEVVVKPLSSIIGVIRGISGITILGDGYVVPVLDVNTMV